MCSVGFVTWSSLYKNIRIVYIFVFLPFFYSLRYKVDKCCSCLDNVVEYAGQTCITKEYKRPTCGSGGQEKEIALLVSKRERGLLFLVACHGVLGLVAAITKVTRTKIVSQRTVPSYLLLLERKSCLVYKTGLYLWLILFLPANLIILAIHPFRSAKEVFKQFYYIFDFSILRRGEGCITIVTKNCMNSAASLELRRN